VSPALQPVQIEAVLQAGGAHPHGLRVLGAQFLRGRPEGQRHDRAARRSRELVPFFEASAQAAGPGERPLLRWRAGKGNPVTLREAARALKVTPLTTPADVLCYRGFVRRWTWEKGAQLHANCRLFNDWSLVRRKPLRHVSGKMPDGSRETILVAGRVAG